MVVQVVEETYNCSEECESLNVSIDQNQLAYRLIKLRIRVLRANIGKLLCLCVPAREKWTEFGWDGKTVDEILDDLSNIDIPTCHPGDPDFQRTFEEHERLNEKFIDSEEIQQRTKPNLKDLVNHKNMDSSSKNPMVNKNEEENDNGHTHNDLELKVDVTEMDIDGTNDKQEETSIQDKTQSC